MNDSHVHFRKTRRRSRHGFTLVEMVLAGAIMSILVGGLFSAVLLASRVADTTGRRAALDLHGVLERFRQDAALATAITAYDSDSVTMTVPDRDGNGTPETIAYDWKKADKASGFIKRTENGVAESITVQPSSFVVSFDFDQTATGDVVESSEQLLFSRTPALPIAYAIKSSQWTGQYVIPSLPASAQSWRVTRVRFPARYKGSTPGSTRVQIRSQSGGLPKTVIDEATMLESSLGASYATQEFSFTKAKNLPVNSGICVVLQWVADADACEVQYESLLALLASGNRVTSTTQGASWTANTLQAMALDVYGTYSVPSNTTTRKLRSLTIQIKADATMSVPMTTKLRFTNLPLVSG